MAAYLNHISPLLQRINNPNVTLIVLSPCLPSPSRHLQPSTSCDRLRIQRAAQSDSGNYTCNDVSTLFYFIFYATEISYFSSRHFQVCRR